MDLLRRIAVIGDVHDQRERLCAVLAALAFRPVDLALLVGDIGVDLAAGGQGRIAERRAHDASVRYVVETVHRALACPVVFVPGNHDLPDPCADLPAVNCDGSTVEIAGLRLLGLGGSGPRAHGFPYEWTEESAERRLRGAEGAAGQIDVMISHAPPANTPLDRTADEEHAGSRSVARAIERLRPRLFVCGHIHEAWGVAAVHGCPALNAGSLGEPYGQAIGWRVEWDGGRTRFEAVPAAR